jgi:hypothetical protein
MLGCQDFCGYYDWTFHYMRRRFGQDAVHKLWEQAIATDSQQHYIASGKSEGLRGLYRTWVKTGEEEQCDWTFTLDEHRNVLRMDMRRCPSKGFLLDNDLNADEDYCDHCMGWIGPALKAIGAEVASHEHNHCGQCWWEMRMMDKPYRPLDLDIDIRKSPDWGRGYVEGWRSNAKLPLLEQDESTDPCQALSDWYAGTDHLTVLGRGPSAADSWMQGRKSDAVIVTDPTYALRDVFDGDPVGVLIGDRPENLKQVAKRFNATPPEQRPLLMHPFLPGNPMIDFVCEGLPRPVPILPLLIRAGLYTHQPGKPYPTTGTFALMLAIALEKQTTIAGIDLYKHPSGNMYNNEPAGVTWPSWHSEACDVAHIRLALNKATRPVYLHPFLEELIRA